MKKKISILLILLGTISMVSCKKQTNKKTVMNILKSDKKYDFTIAACAPNLYPAEVIDGGVSLADGTSQRIPSGAILKTGWGGLAPIHANDLDLIALPVAFNITWVSYVEKKFYRGTFDLDKNRIASLFKNGFDDERNEHRTFDEVKVGLAPGGVAVVWLNGGGTQVEVGRFIAKSVEVTKDYFIPDATISIDQYLEENLKEDLPEQYQNSDFMDNIPFGLWDTYRKKYTWKTKVQFTNDTSNVTSMVIYYYNGERFFTHGKNKKLLGFKENAIPKYISIIWNDKNDNSFGTRIKFGRIYDDDNDLKEVQNELFTAFKTIFNNAEQAELLIKIDKYNSNLELFMVSKKDTIKLSKPKVKVYIKSKK